MVLRGDGRVQGGMFSHMSLEERVPADHPLREARKVTDTVLRSLSAEFNRYMRSRDDRRSLPSLSCGHWLLQVFFSVLSEMLVFEQIDNSLLFRWFVRLGMDDTVWSHAVFSKNRCRLLNSEVAQHFFAEVNCQAEVHVRRPFHNGRRADLGVGFAEGLRPKDGLGGYGTNFHGQSEPIRRTSPRPIPMRGFTSGVTTRSRG